VRSIATSQKLSLRRFHRLDVAAANQINKRICEDMSSTPYSSVEQAYSAGALVDVIYSFTNVMEASAGRSDGPASDIVSADGLD
jgi:hypothetical protein